MSEVTTVPSTPSAVDYSSDTIVLLVSQHSAAVVQPWGCIYVSEVLSLNFFEIHIPVLSSYQPHQLLRFNHCY